MKQNIKEDRATTIGKIFWEKSHKISTTDIFLGMFRLILEKLFRKAPLNDWLGKVFILYSKPIINCSLGRAA